MKKTIIYIGFLLAFVGTAQAQEGLKGEIEVSNVSLSVFGDSLRVQMDMDFSALHLPSNRSLSLLPSLRMDTAIIRLPEVDVMGRRQYIQWQRKADRAAMTQVIRRYNSTTQHLHYQTAVPIAERLGLVRLYLDEDSCGCLREVLANRNRLLAEQDFTPAVFVPHFVYVSPQAETRKTRHEKGAAYVDFPVNKTGIYPAYRNNRSELAKIENTINRIKGDADVSINNITIKGYASPEGSYANNSRLAEARTRSLVDYLKKEYPLDSSLFQLDYEPEDWEGLRAYVIRVVCPKGCVTRLDRQRFGSRCQRTPFAHGISRSIPHVAARLFPGFASFRLCSGVYRTRFRCGGSPEADLERAAKAFAARDVCRGADLRNRQQGIQ